MSSTRKIPDNRGKTYKKSKMDERVIAFRKNYSDPQSPTFQNALQSALRAGYSREYAENLTKLAPSWFREMQQDMDVVRARMLATAERNIGEMLTYNDEKGEKRDIATLKLKASTFVSERLGKEIYSPRQEITDKDGRRLFGNNTHEKHKTDLKDLFVGVQAVKDIKRT